MKVFTVSTMWADGTGSIYTFATLKKAQKFCGLLNQKCGAIIWAGQPGGMRVATYEAA